MVPLAHILDTNFCDILHTSVPLLESFRLFAGQIIYTILFYVFAILAGTGIVFIQSKTEERSGGKNQL